MTIYYTATGAPVGGSRGISEAVRSEFELIEAAFAALGPPGSTALSLAYKFDATTTAADPGPGYLRLNNATAASASEAYIDLVDTNGVTQTDLLAVLGASTSTVKSYMRIVKVDDTTVHRTYSVSALATPAGYRTPTIAHVSGAGVFAQDDDIYIEIARTGDKGEAGANGITTFSHDERNSNTALTNAVSGTHIRYASGTTITQTFDAVATLSADWYVILDNSGNTGEITLDPSGAETIDSLSSYKMYGGEVRKVQRNEAGTGFTSTVLKPFYAAFTASGTFTKPPGYSYFHGLLWGGGGAGGRHATGAGSGGGGGACVSFQLSASAVGTTETVTIAAATAGPTTNTTGGAGGTSTFGALATAYGGGGGGSRNGGGSGGAGGGGVFAAGGAGNSAAGSGATGGAPLGATAEADSTFGGGGGGGTSAAGGRSVHGGGGGGMGATDDTGTAGGASLYGGGGGGGSDTTGAAGGTSSFGGSGGQGNGASSGADGTAPGGGGGGTRTGAKAGDGARGELRIWGVA